MINLFPVAECKNQQYVISLCPEYSSPPVKILEYVYYTSLYNY